MTIRRKEPKQNDLMAQLYNLIFLSVVFLILCYISTIEMGKSILAAVGIVWVTVSLMEFTKRDNNN